MFEEVICQKNKNDMVKYLDRINADYIIVAGQENSYYEIEVIDIDGMLYQICYDSSGNLIRYDNFYCGNRNCYEKVF